MPPLDPPPQAVLIYRALDAPLDDLKVVIKEGSHNPAVCDAPWLDPYWDTITIDEAADLVSLASTIHTLKPTWCVRLRGWDADAPDPGTFKCGWLECDSTTDFALLGNEEREFEYKVGGPDDVPACAVGRQRDVGDAGYTPLKPNDIDAGLSWSRTYYRVPGTGIGIVSVVILASEFADSWPYYASPDAGGTLEPEFVRGAPGVTRIVTFWDFANQKDVYAVCQEHWGYTEVSVADLIRPKFNWLTKDVPYYYNWNGSDDVAFPAGDSTWVAHNCRPASGLQMDIF